MTTYSIEGGFLLLQYACLSDQNLKEVRKALKKGKHKKLIRRLRKQTRKTGITLLALPQYKGGD